MSQAETCQTGFVYFTSPPSRNTYRPGLWSTTGARETFAGTCTGIGIRGTGWVCGINEVEVREQSPSRVALPLRSANSARMSKYSPVIGGILPKQQVRRRTRRKFGE
ncbi:unnamed protein product [Sphagnum jensenii]|uniref:Uncharacterized protein n=1 Tax=Sphagnum jensenii TaxID=128206 RepID=A0ABP0VFM5_9BRYO